MSVLKAVFVTLQTFWNHLNIDKDLTEMMFEMTPKNEFWNFITILTTPPLLM